MFVGIKTNNSLVYVKVSQIVTIRHLFGKTQEVQMTTGVCYETDVELSVLLASLDIAVFNVFDGKVVQER